ncbi:heme NO-binding domain-containing protein [Massilia sp. AB1]|uniref:heme NO-binding domain-containing protein n=1 Tax=Massilia sp. AB1 TaxID=2823371 RepID=UPI001B811230|nr:heme NO-binding domain-containing protein [Massilia sp. AB1]MBQ5940831.1 heme NO-binding domain-containing protein [Massilia sp. AB1]
MKGIVFNLLEEAVTTEFGEATWDRLLDDAGLDGAYTSLGSYDDAEVFRLVEVASAALNIPPQDVLRWFGRRAMPILVQRYPGFFAPHTSARSFLLTLNNLIHPEVRKLYPGATPPVFDFDTSSNETLVIGYNSQRKLCALAEGFMQGAASHFGEQADVHQSQCMHEHADKCVFHVRFAK